MLYVQVMWVELTKKKKSNMGGNCSFWYLPYDKSQKKKKRSKILEDEKNIVFLGKGGRDEFPRK